MSQTKLKAFLAWTPSWPTDNYYSISSRYYISQLFYLQGVFVGKTSGRVYVCQECDDYQEQCIVCIAYSVEHFLVRGPQKLLQYNKPQCLFENCYGCFDPLIKDRVLSSIGL